MMVRGVFEMLRGKQGILLLVFCDAKAEQLQNLKNILLKINLKCEIIVAGG